MAKPPRVGVDIGGVLTARMVGSLADDTALTTKSYLHKPPFVGAFTAVQTLVTWFNPKNTFVISRCSIAVEQATREWLEYQRFYQLTRLSPDNVYYCRERADKAPRAKKLGLTHFIDDQAEVLAHMQGIVEHRYLFGPQSKPVPSGMIAAPTWPMTLRHILVNM